MARIGRAICFIDPTSEGVRHRAGNEGDQERGDPKEHDPDVYEGDPFLRQVQVPRSGTGALEGLVSLLYSAVGCSVCDRDARGADTAPVLRRRGERSLPPTVPRG